MIDSLKKHRQDFDAVTLNQLFANDPNRAARFSFEAAGLRVDLSKNHLTDETKKLLFGWAEEVELAAAIKRLFEGGIVNASEGRQAWHPKVRDLDSAEVQKSLLQIEGFVTSIHNGMRLGANGKPITDVVTIGIGGSDLGTRLVVDALAPYRLPGLTTHFVSNLDSVETDLVLEVLDPDSTLFIVCSKSFTTRETMVNAERASYWLSQHNIHDKRKHFVAVTANPQAVAESGLPVGEVFSFNTALGGRFSLWSSIGLPIALELGMDNFRALLSGAAQMDLHFQEAPFENNLPVLLALVGAWYINYWGVQSRAVIPYVHGLRQLPSYLRQLEMESNGKSITTNNERVEGHTCGVVWGASGTIGQHSFSQMLHQGTYLVPVEFISVLGGASRNCAGYTEMFANCLSQSRILMTGKTLEEVEAEMRLQGANDDMIASLAPQKVLPGNRPSTTILLDQLNPKSLGALLALYEHKVYVQSVLWGINAFDQWGVEYGKQLGAEVYDVLKGKRRADKLDSSTQQMITLFIEHR